MPAPGRLTLGRLLGFALIASFAAAEALTRIPFIAGFSANAAVSAGLLIALTLYVASSPRAHAVQLPLVIWFGSAWFVVRVVDSSDTVAGLQQLITWMVFVGAMIFAAARSERQQEAFLRAVEWVSLVWALYLILVSTVDAASAVAGWAARATAAMLAVGFAVSVARAVRAQEWRAGLTAAIIFLALLLSESRTASMVCFVVALAIWWSVAQRWRVTFVLRSTAVVAAAILLAIFVLQMTPLGARVMTVISNAGTVMADPEGGVARGVTQGRSAVWVGLLAKGLEAPWVGHGLGAASAAAHEITQSERWHHPHNDYLRVFVDSGVIGLALFVVGLATLVRRSYGSVRRSRDARGRSAVSASAGFGALIVLCALMITDNVVVYTYVMVPIALTVGQGLSLTAVDAQA
jgi:O-antigen ligase